MYDFDAPVVRRGTHCEKWDGMKERFGSDDLLPFWVADMDFRCAPEIVGALAHRVEHGVFGYSAMYDEALDAVAEWQRTRHGWSVRRDAIRFVPGVVTGLVIAIHAFTKPGEKIIIQTPVYPPFFNVVTGNARELLTNPLIEGNERYEIDFDNLEKLAASGAKAMLLSSPHNPVARVWSRGELARLGKICATHGVMIFSDEIHEDITFDGVKHTPLAIAAPELAPYLVTLVAPSKTFNIAGLSASAWIAEDENVRGAMERTASALHMTEINALGIVALEAAYRHGAAWVDELVRYLQDSRDFTLDFLDAKLPRVQLKKPEGTFIFWLDFRDYGLSCEELQRVLTNEACVALNAGSTFGAAGEGFARLNVGCTRAMLAEGLKRIERAFKNR